MEEAVRPSKELGLHGHDITRPSPTPTPSPGPSPNLRGLAARAARDERAALQHRLLPLGERGGGVGRSAAERREGTVVEALAQQRAQ